MAFVVAGPKTPGPYVFEDHRVSLSTVHHMRAGEGFYDAFDEALREAEIGPAETLRAFRMPTLYLAWRWLPGDARSTLWVAFVVTMAAAGVVLLRQTTVALGALMATLYLLLVGRELLAGIYLMAEFWVVPLAAAAILAWQSRREGVAAGFALAATLVRELAVGLLVGGFVAAVVGRRPRRPWLVAGAVAVGALVAHWLAARHHLVPGGQGKEAPLLGSGRFPVSVMRAMGFALPRPDVVGPVLWGVAVWWLARTGRLLFLAPYVALPLSGFLVHRAYWGILTVPFTIVWASEALATASGRVWRAVTTRTATTSGRGAHHE